MKSRCLAIGTFTLAAFGCAGSGGGQPSTASWVREGLRAAQRSYWQEAHFRFAAAHRQKPEDARILNNLAVTLEALGRWDEALDAYKKALALAPADRSIRRNYARFAEFYTSFARGAKPKEGDGHAPR